jgi:hypothetical protein
MVPFDGKIFFRTKAYVFHMLSKNNLDGDSAGAAAPDPLIRTWLTAGTAWAAGCVSPGFDGPFAPATGVRRDEASSVSSRQRRPGLLMLNGSRRRFPGIDLVPSAP